MTSETHRLARLSARVAFAFCAALFCCIPIPADAKVTVKSATKQSAALARTSETTPESRPVADDPTPSENDASVWFQDDTAPRLRDDVLERAKRRRAAWPDFQPLKIAKIKELGIRRIQTKRIDFYTDLAASPDVDQIPEALEAAIPKICQFFKIDEARFDDLHIDAFLMNDPAPFIELGALDAPPQFLHGYSFGDRIYAKRHDSPYYNRFLLTHELVHTIMHELFGDLRPQWFSEGVAEYLGLHRWNPKTKEIEIAYRPESEDETPGFGRVRAIRKANAAGLAPTILQMLRYEPADFADTTAYAWCWAFVTFLHNTPKYRDLAEALPYWAIAARPNQLFIDAVGDRWGELEYDWTDFVSHIDYEYDFQRAAIDRSARIDADYDLAQGVVVTVDPAKGWQATGLELKANQTYQIVAAGRFKYYLPDADKVMEFEAPGATCEYLFGKPAGRLLAAVAPDVQNASFADVNGVDESQRPEGNDMFRFQAFKNQAFPRFGNETNPLYPWDEIFEYSSSRMTMTPTRDGELYLRINALPKCLKENSGLIKAKIKSVD